VVVAYSKELCKCLPGWTDKNHDILLIIGMGYFLNAKYEVRQGKVSLVLN